MERLILPRPIWPLLAIYFVASLTHFAHNAEYIAFYPNMPGWITRENVYIAWAAINAVGLAGLLFVRVGWTGLGLVSLAAYGLMGLDGLGHYTLALCSEHSLAMNATIWFEVVAGAALAVACGWFLFRSQLRTPTHAVL